MSARGVNKVTIIGNLGQEPEVRYTPGGKAVANASVATNESWKDKESGEQREKTEWHKVVFWGRLAEVVGEYLHKGSRVYIEGKLQTSKWTDKEGNDRYTTEIVANELLMLGGGIRNDDQDGDDEPRRPAERVAPPRVDDLDDDIPF